MKKLFFILFLFSVSAFAEDRPLSIEEQRQLLNDVQVLKEKVKTLQGTSSPADEEQARQMLETIKKGRQYQLEQQRALDELDIE